MLQQFLAVSRIASSHSPGILLVNCDTLSLKKLTGLPARQKTLLASLEYHVPHFVLFNKLFGLPKAPECIFVTHHMLYQTDLLRKILGLTEEYSISDVLEQAV